MSDTSLTSKDLSSCATHAAEHRSRETMPCPWCVIDELKRNRDDWKGIAETANDNFQKLLKARSSSHEPSAELYAEVIRLREEVKGPDGFATWKDAAVSERVKRVELERRISEPPAPAHLGRGDAVRIGPNIRGEYSETMTITHVMFTLNHGAATVPDDAVVRAPSTKSEADTVMSKVRQHFDEQRDRDGYHSELERLEFAPPADPGPVQTFEPNGPERGFATMCANCGQTFGKHIAQDHHGNSSVCPVHETSGDRT